MGQYRSAVVMTGLSLAACFLLFGGVGKTNEEPRKKNERDIRFLLESRLHDYSVADYEGIVESCSQLLDDEINRRDKKLVGELYLRRAYAQTMLKELELADKDYEAAGRDLPDDPRVLWGKAMVHVRARPDESVKQLEQVVRNYPSFARAYVTLAFLRQRKNEYQSALDLSNHAIDIPETKSDLQLLADAYAGRANAHYGLNHLQHSLEDINRSIELSPFGSEVPEARYHLRAEVLAALHQYDRAEMAAQAVLRINNKHFRAYYIWWKACVHKGRYETANRIAKECASKLPGDAFDIESLKVCTSNLLELYDDALAHAKKADLIRPNSPLIQKEMAIAYEGLKKFKEADDAFKRALSGERSYEILLGRAFFLVNCPKAEMRNPQEAMQLIIEARAAVDNRDWRCELALTQARAEAGEFDKALEGIEEYGKSGSLPSEARVEFELAAESFRKKSVYRSLRNYGVHGR